MVAVEFFEFGLLSTHCSKLPTGDRIFLCGVAKGFGNPHGICHVLRQTTSQRFAGRKVQAPTKKSPGAAAPAMMFRIPVVTGSPSYTTSGTRPTIRRLQVPSPIFRDGCAFCGPYANLPLRR